MQAHHIGLAEQLSQGCVIETRESGRRLLDRVEGQHVHPECIRQRTHPSADTAETHNADFFAAQQNLRSVPEAPVRRRLPLPRSHGPVVSFHPVAERQQQGEDELGHRLRTVLRNIRNRNSALPGSGDIHHVVAGSRDRDESQNRQLIQGRL